MVGSWTVWSLISIGVCFSIRQVCLLASMRDSRASRSRDLRLLSLDRGETVSACSGVVGGSDILAVGGLLLSLLEA